MKIAIGADHAGFALKESLKRKLVEWGHEVTDCGTGGDEAVDYPDFASAVAREVSGGRSDRGVLVCTTGVGMSIAANKVPGIRAALAVNLDEVFLTRSHNDANILTLGSRYTNEGEAEKLLDVFLTTPFVGGRHARRVEKITALEKNGSDAAAQDES